MQAVGGAGKINNALRKRFVISKGKVGIAIGVVIVFLLWYVFIQLPQQEEDDLIKRGCVLTGTRGSNGIQETYVCTGENLTVGP